MIVGMDEDKVRRWQDQGCEVCRHRIMSSDMKHIGDSNKGRGFLMRCDVCGAFWEELERYSYQIDEATARQDYPDAFDPGDP